MAYVVTVSEGAICAPDELRRVLVAATQQLLGSTITLSDVAWFAPTALPGWSRAHVATHLNLHGQAVIAILQGVAAGRTPSWHPVETEAALKAGGRRDAITLQEELDRSAADVMRVIDAIGPDRWQVQVRSRFGTVPVWQLLVARLNEVILHHVDLAVGYSLSDLDPQVATTLLYWNLHRAEARFSQVTLELTADEGWTESIGSGPLVQISGSIAALLGWITGRLDAAAVLGAESLAVVPLA